MSQRTVEGTVSAVSGEEQRNRTEGTGDWSTAMEFGRALGGDPDTVSDLPFRATAEDVSEAVYVRHDDEMLTQVSTWLVEGEHIHLHSGAGTGKSALRSVVERDLDRRWDFVVGTVTDPASITDRGLCETVLRTARGAGYEVDPDDYWQVDDGVPWLTEEVGTAIPDVTSKLAADDARLLLLVDGVDRLDPKLAETLTGLGAAGVQLCLLGREGDAEVPAALAEDLDEPVRSYDGIGSFDRRAIAEYIARSLAAFRGESYDGTPSGLFSGDAIEYIHETTDGNPRAVRETCFALFVRAAAVWDQLDTDIERVTITSALADRDIDHPAVRSL